MDKQAEPVHFPPVVAVLGHVDHGKTSLLDALRKSNIADREHGGITQKIGASSIETVHEGKKRSITFIDTPGHEAFSNMRSRGAMAADVAILVVAATDGIMPQTRESIRLIQNSGVPFVVALTKADLPTKNPERVKQQLLGENVLLEGLGGDVPIIEVSAKTGLNLKELLDLILLVQEMSETTEEQKPSSSGKLKGIVIESKLDPKSGPKATVIIKNGTLSVRDEVTADSAEGKIRTLITDKGTQVKEATVGDAVEVLGFTSVPPVGSVVEKKGETQPKAPDQVQQKASSNELTGLEALFAENSNKLPIILVADTQGSLEAITVALGDEVKVIEQKTGDITERDILLAKSTGALVLGFNLKVGSNVSKLAHEEKVLVRSYTIIYEMLDELRDVLEGRRLQVLEDILGTAEVLASFPYEKTKVLGIKVREGRVARGDKIRLIRGETPLGEAIITSVRQGKNVVSKVEEGNEAGIVLNPLLDFTIGDMIICHR